MKTNDHKSEILDRFKLANNISSNADLARFLSLKPSTVSNWYTRGSIDYDLIFSKCKRINFDWLITGEWQMTIEESNSSIINEPPPEYKKASSGLMDEFYIDVIAKKEIEIKELNRNIGKLEYIVENLRSKLEMNENK